MQPKHQGLPLRYFRLAWSVLLLSRARRSAGRCRAPTALRAGESWLENKETVDRVLVRQYDTSKTQRGTPVGLSEATALGSYSLCEFSCSENEEEKTPGARDEVKPPGTFWFAFVPPGKDSADRGMSEGADPKIQHLLGNSLQR